MNETKFPDTVEREAFSCPYCSRSFPRKCYLGSHLKSHKESFFCVTCGKTFTRKWSLKVHKATVHPCKKSNFLVSRIPSFNKEDPMKSRKENTENLLLNESASSNQGLFFCSICDKSFTRKWSWKVHHRQQHPKNEFPSTVANNTFNEEQNVVTSSEDSRKTMVSSANTNKKYFACEFCNRTFHHHYSLIIHLRTHSNKKQHFCLPCNRSFTRNSSLKRHNIALHPNDKPFLVHHSAVPTIKEEPNSIMNPENIEEKLASQADFGSFSAQPKGNLRTYLHNCRSGRKKNSSNIFSKSLNLKRLKGRALFRKYAPGEKSFACDYCHRIFLYKHHLGRHMRVHRKKKPSLACPRCDQLFSHDAILKNHILRVHAHKMKVCDPLSSSQGELDSYKISDGKQTVTLEQKKNMDVEFGIKMEAHSVTHTESVFASLLNNQTLEERSVEPWNEAFVNEGESSSSSWLPVVKVKSENHLESLNDTPSATTNYDALALILSNKSLTVFRKGSPPSPDFVECKSSIKLEETTSTMENQITSSSSQPVAVKVKLEDFGTYSPPYGSVPVQVTSEDSKVCFQDMQSSPCPSCSRSFCVRSFFLKQIDVHRTGNHLLCLFCKEIFLNPTLLKKHLKKNHRAFLCSSCSLSFSTEGSLYEHVSRFPKEQHNMCCTYCRQSVYAPKVEDGFSYF